MAKVDGLLPRFLHFQTKIKYTENQNIEVQLENVTDHDWVEVVRCKDCRWWTKQEKSLQGRCELAGFYPTGEWFCANGERSNCGAEMNPNLDTTKGERRDESSG